MDPGQAVQQQQQQKDETVSPVGDFIALVGGFAAFIFALLLTWYKPTQEGIEAVKGVKSVPGIICFAVGIGVFVFAIVVLVGKFINPNFRLIRSPGWVYALAASVIFMVCIVGLVVTPTVGSGVETSVNVGPFLELFAAAAIGIAGMLKF